MKIKIIMIANTDPCNHETILKISTCYDFITIVGFESKWTAINSSFFKIKESKNYYEHNSIYNNFKEAWVTANPHTKFLQAMR